MEEMERPGETFQVERVGKKKHKKPLIMELFFRIYRLCECLLVIVVCLASGFPKNLLFCCEDADHI